MSDIPSLYKSTSYWDFVRCKIEHEYWRNVERDLTPDNMPRRVYELADLLQQDAEFAMRAVGGDWRFSSSNSNLRLIYDHFVGVKKVLAVSPRVSAVETAAYRLLPANVEWQVYDAFTGEAFLVVTRIRPPEPAVDRFADYRNFL